MNEKNKESVINVTESSGKENENSNTETQSASQVSDRESILGMSKKQRALAALIFPIVIFLFIYFFIIKEEKVDDPIKSSKVLSEQEIENISKVSVPSTQEKVQDIQQDNSIIITDEFQEMPEIEAPVAPKPKSKPKKETDRDFFNPFDFSSGDTDGKNNMQPTTTAPIDAPTISPPVISELPTAANPNIKQPQGTSPSIGSLEPGPSTTARSKERYKAKMVVLGGGKDKSEKSEKNATKEVNKDMPLPKTSAGQITNSYYGDRSSMILQGKLIDIVLETTINTDLSGPLRGVVSSDVFAESGKNILIPKGSRAIGTYSFGNKGGDTRVAISFTRIIRPDGIDIMIDSTGTDRIGRAGVTGEVNTHLAEKIRNSLVVSLLTIVNGVLVNELFDDEISAQTVNTDGSITTSSNLARTETRSAFDDITSDLEDALKKTEKVKPTVTVHAGHLCKAYVNKDIIFLQKTATTFKAIAAS